VGEEDRVAGTALFQASADVLYLDGEPAMAQALLEFFVLSGGPDGQHAVALESGEGGGDSAVVVEAGIVRAGEGGRAIVYVEEHGVELAAPRSECDGDVVDLDLHARIYQRISGERAEGAAIPVDYGGDNFGDDNLGVRWEEIERCAQRETHAEAADENARLLQSQCLVASKCGERFFRTVHAAGHKAFAVGEDDVFVAAADQLQDGAVARKRLAEQLDRLHEAMLQERKA
jgi:hypothetical protein